MKTKKPAKSLFEQMFADLPDCLIGGGCDDATDPEEMIHLAKVQLDLIEEGQDGTEEDDPDAIRKWLKRWA